MNINRDTCFTVHLEDKPGQIANISVQLREGNVDLTGLWGWGMPGGQAQAIVTVKNPSQFETVAKKAGWRFEKSTCFRFQCDDKPGAMLETLGKISKGGVNLMAVDSVGVAGKVGGCFWVDASQVEKLGKVLGA